MTEDKKDAPIEEVKAEAAAATETESKKYLDEPTGEMVSKSELKKRQKMREKEAKAAAKAAEKAAKEAEKPQKKKVEGAAADEELDPSKYTENRRQFIQSKRDAGVNPYPHKFSRTHRVDEFRELFD